MADSEGKNYYWKSLDQNTTGENVGVVLDSLCDIVAENEIEENQDVIKWVPGEEGQKGHFELGEGGSQVPPINASVNQILIGNEENWAEGNLPNFYALNTVEEVEEEIVNKESIIGITYDINLPPAFGSFDFDENENVYLKNGFISLNNAIEKIQGGSSITIGEKDADYSDETVPKYKSDDNIIAPNINIGGTTIIDIEGGIVPYHKPVISMKGNGIIEFDEYDEHSCGKYYHRNLGITGSYPLSGIANAVYGSYAGPYGKDIDYPFIKMSNSSTILMEGAPLFKMSDGAGVEIAGSAGVVIRGEGGSVTDKPGKTGVLLEPGSFVRMANDGDYGSMISVSGGQIILTCQRPMNNTDTEFTYPKNLAIDSIGGHFRFVTIPRESLDYPNIATVNTNIISQFCSEINSKIFKPSIEIAGKTAVYIGDHGYFTAKIGPTNDAFTSFDWTDDTASKTDIKFGSGANAVVTYDIGTETGAVACYTIRPKEGTRTCVLFAPKEGAITNLNITPGSGTFTKLNVTPQTGAKTNFDIQPKGGAITNYKFLPQGTADITIESTNSFIHKTGMYHNEDHGGVFIMRQTNPIGASYGNHIGHLNKEWLPLIQSSNGEPIMQMYDGANFAMIGEQGSTSYLYSDTYEFTSSTSITTWADFEASEYYQTFIDYLASINRVMSSHALRPDSTESGSSYIISFHYGYTRTTVPHLNSAIDTNAPVFEMRDTSEIRFYGGAYIKAETINEITTFTFGSNESGEQEVSFTIADLQVLKDIIEGGGSELPDASESEF